MKKIGIIYGSSTGNTASVAETIAEKLSDYEVETIEVSEASEDSFTSQDVLVLGSSTWGMGDLQDDWEDFLSELEDTDLSGKTVAIFGLGDSDSYPDTFCDAIGTLYDFFEGKGCKMVGAVSTDGYTFDESTAVRDDKFVGLPLNEDGESDLTEERVENWVEALKAAI